MQVQDLTARVRQLPDHIRADAVAADQHPAPGRLFRSGNGSKALACQAADDFRIMDQIPQRAGRNSVLRCGLCHFHGSPDSHTEAGMRRYLNRHDQYPHVPDLLLF